MPRGTWHACGALQTQHKAQQAAMQSQLPCPRLGCDYHDTSHLCGMVDVHVPQGMRGRSSVSHDFKGSLAACDWSGCAAADALWLPNTERPEWLDGSMPGDRGFDPLGLAKPTEYLQVSTTFQRQSLHLSHALAMPLKSAWCLSILLSVAGAHM